MNRLFRRTIAAAASLFLCTLFSLSLRAQEPIGISGTFRIGVSGGATFSSMEGKMIRQIPDNGCPVNVENDNLGEVGWATGAVAEYTFGSRFGIASHFLYSTHPGSWIYTLWDAMVLFPNPDPNKPAILLNEVVRSEGDIRYEIFGVDLMGKAILLPIDGGGAGLTAGLAWSHKERFTLSSFERLIAPAEARFVNPIGFETRDSGRTLVLSENTPVANAASARLSLRGGTFYDLRLFDRLHVTPGVYYDYGLTKVAKDINWGLNAWFFQLDLTMEL